MSAAAAKLTDVVSDNGGWHGPAKLGREASSESMAKLALDHATHSAELALDHAARCNHPHCSDSQMSPAALNVRPSGPGDLVPLSFFFDTVLRKDYFVRRGQLAEILGGKRHRVFVAELDGVLVGVAILTSGSRLVNALVHPAYRGLGIGAELVDASGAREVRAKIDMSTGAAARVQRPRLNVHP